MLLLLLVLMLVLLLVVVSPLLFLLLLMLTLVLVLVFMLLLVLVLVLCNGHCYCQYYSRYSPIFLVFIGKHGSALKFGSKQAIVFRTRVLLMKVIYPSYFVNRRKINHVAIVFIRVFPYAQMRVPDAHFGRKI